MTDQQRAAETADSSGGRPETAADAESAPRPPSARRERASEEEGPAAPSGPEDGRADPGDDGGGSRKEVSEQTVEAVVRAQLSKALGGKRGMVETAVPTLAFTLSYLAVEDLRLALGLGFALAIGLGAVRLAQRSSVQFVVNSLFGMGIAAFFALRSGEAEDFALPGIIYNAVYAVVLTLTILVRWPAMGLLIGAVTGDVGAWRANPAVVRLSSRLTWLLVAPCLVRVAVQLPLWASEHYGVASTFALLGIAKVAMGWPLQVAAFGAMVWLLARGRTPVDTGTGTADAGTAETPAAGDTGSPATPPSGPRPAD
ncbi:DUF3159 domain-containing protein [Streptomonospora wellingtoniae]|uniref:DUF3159 domain-containing protein n=1 Tax=Streptomonospora wellingtoniae TaxID=3075544 RepID=A0ABU2KUK0_9ACTN|nr:DUF3159 domain-containing protein [Streptomonospora sp. DSM 45055]MDT0302972.1 DUF3159 domain-containing protein [Streptomonospora sp. DSM 45055]